MSNSILVMGESGTGKSRSIKNLDSRETFIISVVDKDLPFKGARKLYKESCLDSEGVKIQGNRYSSDNYSSIIKVMKVVSEKMPKIKNIVIDDFQYIMFNEFMCKANEQGFAKFTVIQQHAFDVLSLSSRLRADLNCFILSHTQVSAEGLSRFKTLGKMLDEKITVEGLFTIVLHSIVDNNQYRFLTQNTGSHLAKSPEGMFNDKLIENDLQFVINKMEEYYNEDIESDLDLLRGAGEEVEEVKQIKQIKKVEEVI